jgi:Fic family protein
MLLGEAASKCDHVGSLPLKPYTAERLGIIYLAKGMHGTTAIEGNPLTEEQVQQHIEGQLELPDSQAYLKREVDNVLKVVTEITDAPEPTGNPQISPDLICHFNATVLAGLELPVEVIPGQIRRHSVEVMRYLAPLYQDCAHLLQRYCDWMNSAEFVGDKANRSAVAILKAVLAHLYLAWIHPFGDGNGRTARLLEFYILVHAGIPSLSAHLFSNHYMLTRDLYLRKLDEARRDIIPFLEYAVGGFVEQLKQQIAAIREQQWQVSWTDYVHEIFDARGSRAQRRRRDLLLGMPWDRYIPRQLIRRITPRVAEAYAGKTDKTITRDLNALMKAGLLKKGPKGGYRPKWELLLGFLPPSFGPDLED